MKTDRVRAGWWLFGCAALAAASVSACAGGHGGASAASSGSSSSSSSGAMTNGTPGDFNVFDAIPQFGIYTSSNPMDYTPPTGVLMWSYGTVWLTQLTADQKKQIGSDLVARVTYLAQCDNYDRLGGLFYIAKPHGEMPAQMDPRIEIVRWITPFSDYTEGALAKHVYPDVSLAPFAQALADPTQDVWVGITGGSNPYNMDPCVALDAGADFSQVGFKYSVDFVSTQTLTLAPSVVLSAVSTTSMSQTAVPIKGTFTNPGTTPLVGHVTVIVSGHGSGLGGDEYENTMDTVTVGSTTAGTFSTAIDCAPYASASPDGNPGIFQGNTSGNPRNWCPGAIVAPHTYPVTLAPGDNAVSLAITPAQVPMGSYYATSITFTSP